MQQFLKKIVLVIPLFLVISFLNFTLDRKNLFQDKQVEKASTLIFKGETVKGLSLQNRFKLNLEYIKKVNAATDVLVIGPSDCERFNKHFFPNRSITNHWALGGGLYYQVAIVGLYRQKKSLPKEVIFSFRPFIFSKPAHESIRFLKDPYIEMLDHLNLKSPQYNNNFFVSSIRSLNQLISFKYLIFNLKEKSEQIEAISTTEDYTQAYTRPDLSTENVFESLRTHSPSVIEETKETYFHAMDNAKESYKTLHTKLLQYLIEEGVKVKLFVLPFHPIMFQDSEFSKSMNQWDLYCDSLASSIDIEIIGRTNPETYGLVHEDFFDITHITDGGLEKIFKHHQIETEL